MNKELVNDGLNNWWTIFGLSVENDQQVVMVKDGSQKNWWNFQTRRLEDHDPLDLLEKGGNVHQKMDENGDSWWLMMMMNAQPGND